jgi:PKD repeat protein
MAVAAESVSASKAKASQKKFMQADFFVRPTSGRAPLTVHFIDHSRSHSQILHWSWSFGDGKTSSLKNPTHVYKRPGRYTVSLTVKCPHGAIDTKKSV